MTRPLLNSIEEFIELISREKSNLKTVHGKIESTCHEFLAIRSCLRGVDGGDDEKEVRRWQELQRITDEAEAAIVKYVLGTARLKIERHGRRKEFLKKFHRSCNPLFVAHKKITKGINRIAKPFKLIYDQLEYYRAHNEILKEIRRISESIKKLKEESSSQCYSGVKSFDDLSDWNLLRSSVVFDEAEEDGLSSLVGLGPDIDYLKQLSSADDTAPCVISVLGIPGIGKTKLALEIYKSSDFLYKAWVCASGMNIDVLSKIKEDIRTQIHYNESQQQGKRCLIVIDDVGDPQISEKLREGEIARDGVGAGSRIILTTRDVEVASHANYSPRMKVLSKVESWELFTSKLLIAPWQLIRITEGGGISPPELDALGRKMVEKCGGIPYLIIDLANILSTKRANIMEWSCVLHGTDTHLPQNQHHWFNLSCFVDDILPSHVKQFLHLFPTGIKIPARRLFLSRPVESLWQQKSKSNIPLWVQDLQDLNLIHASKVSSLGIAKSYRIPPDHPLPQILKAADGAPGGSSPGDDDRKVWIHRIADDYESKGQHFRCIHGNIKSSRELKPYRTLSFFWCFNYPGGYKPGQEVGKFLKYCINSNYLWFLRVLDLEGVYKPRLPMAIGDLFNLRYLGLRWTYLDALPSSVDKLQNLQTLDTKHTDIGYYPWIGYLENLQQLYLNERHQSELVTQLSHLTDLQTLSGVIVDDSSLVNKHGLDKMTNLTKLRLTCRLSDQQRQKAMGKWIGEQKNLETLKLTSNDQRKDQGEEQPFLWEDLIMKNTLLSRLYLQGRLENLVHQNGSGLNLTALTLSLTELATDPMPVLGKLPKLKLLRLFFNSFTGDSMCCSPETFRQLQVLKIWKLKNLQKLTVHDKAMPMLEELEIRSCEKMLEMLHVPKTLRKLKLTNMPKEFTSDVTVNDYQNVSYVSSVTVEDWPSHSETSIKLYTGPSSVFQEALEELLDLDAFKLDLTELTLFETKLKNDPMPELEKMPKLRTLILSSKSFTGKHMVFSTGGFKELQKLTIRELEKLEELTVENGAMPKLEELEISSCKNLKVLPPVLETVKKLKLVNMPKESTEKLKADKRVIVED